MLSKSLAQLVRSLHQKKYRQQEQLFLVENGKSVQEVLASDFRVDLLLCTEAFYKENAGGADRQRCRVEMVTADELTRVGTLESNNAAIAVVRMRPNVPSPTPLSRSANWTLVLDDVRDPGNLGTILRIADWYGIDTILCSETTADVYNPKVISASKGSFTRIQWWYGDVVTVLKPTKLPILGAFLDGDDVHTLPASQLPAGYVVMGNEANGIGPALEPLVTQRITIPRYGAAESLNVGIATAVILDNLRRIQPPPGFLLAKEGV
ncbi:tRNA/rRNA methyltransferase (SpoU) [Fibrella aestuarina BUZ 2]|uniref:tRNA/rRNA methyltransferase (SpoU) n=1 Tax=Fibrella aestuarina BUZ 2 TaxID=1166018 RepID=I0K8R0_9BACT|nr:RNA methyltransferase [Fibrella aestuarina]CCH00513.1 tRNA/rRNA methyltransferase (SpoU) [Fibrella aestuarina BUZ 2]